MWSISKKEFSQFFSSLTGFIAVAGFLLLTGLFLFVFPDTSIERYGYASLQPYFDLAPWILLFLVPSVTMRSFSEEFKLGMFEVLKTRPIGLFQLLLGKYLGVLIIVWVALIPTVVYMFSVNEMAERGMEAAASGLDMGATVGSYIGLFLLAAVYAAVGVACSSYTSNAVAAFLLTVMACFFLYSGFNAISKLPGLTGGADYYLEMLGIDAHYNSISRGVIDLRDIVYFLSVVVLCGVITYKNLQKR